MDNTNNQLLSDLNSFLTPPDAGQNNKSRIVQFNFRVTQVRTKPLSTAIWTGQATMCLPASTAAAAAAGQQPSSSSQAAAAQHTQDTAALCLALAVQQLQHLDICSCSLCLAATRSPPVMSKAA
jgi:hypothetical protein